MCVVVTLCDWLCLSRNSSIVTYILNHSIPQTCPYPPQPMPPRCWSRRTDTTAAGAGRPGATSGGMVSPSKIHCCPWSQRMQCGPRIQRTHSTPCRGTRRSRQSPPKQSSTTSQIVGAAFCLVPTSNHLHPGQSSLITSTLLPTLTPYTKPYQTKRWTQNYLQTYRKAP